MKIRLGINYIEEDEFIRLSDEMYERNDILDRLEFIYNSPNGLYPLFNETILKRNERQFEYGMNIDHRWMAVKVGNFFISKEYEHIKSKAFEEFNSRLVKCLTPAERNDLIQEEIIAIKRKVESDGAQLSGYQEKKRKLPTFTFDFLPLSRWNETTKTTFHFRCESVAKGAALYELENYLRDLFNSSSTAKTIDTKDKSLKSLDDLFPNKDIAGKCYKVLMDLNIIDEDFNHIEGGKAVFCLWIKELERKRPSRNPIIIDRQNDAVYSKLIKDKFNLDSLSESLFRQNNQRAKNDYEHQIIALLSSVKP